MPIQLEQKLDVRKIGPTRWRVVCFVGRAIVFYGEAGSETPNFTATNELAQADLGKWRGIDRGRHLIVGFGGKATVVPKEGGQPGEVQVNFDGIAMAL
jgi:hypothetical protein